MNKDKRLLLICIVVILGLIGCNIYLQYENDKLTKEKDNVKVECSAEAIPKYIDFNVGTGTVGSVYKFGDLEVASEISILDDLNSVIASISYERKTVSDDMDEAQEADIKDVAE